MAASSKKALVGAMAANLLVAVSKFVAGAFTSSSAMITEGIHSLVDCGNSGLMLFGSWRSKREPDDEHPFGYGMELYFWSFVVAMVVFGGGGAVSIVEGVQRFLHPKPVEDVVWSYVVIGLAAIFEGTSLVIGLREFSRYRKEKKVKGSLAAAVHASKDPAMFITVLEDTAALIGLAIAALGVGVAALTNVPQFDAAASVGIGLTLMVEAVILGSECRGLIIGESARPLVRQAIRGSVEKSRLAPLTDLRTLQLGPTSILALLRVHIPREMPAGEVERLAARLAVDVKQATPAVAHVAFEIEPPRSKRTVTPRRARAPWPRTRASGTRRRRRGR